MASLLRVRVRTHAREPPKGETQKMNDDSQQAWEPLAFSFSEAADKLHCSVSAVRRLVKSGILKGFSLSGGSVLTRVTARSVREFVDRAGGGPAHPTANKRTPGRR